MTVNLVTLEDVARFESILQRLEQQIKQTAQIEADYTEMYRRVGEVVTKLEQFGKLADDKIENLNRTLENLQYQDDIMRKLIDVRYKDAITLWGRKKK